MESFYAHDGMVLINYTKTYVNDPSDLLDSEEFKYFICLFMDDLKKTNYDLYTFLTTIAYNRKIDNLIRLLKMLTVLNLDEIEQFSDHERKMLEEVVEAAYLFWRSQQRISVMETYHVEGFLLNSFLDADTQFNTMIRNFYRQLQEKLQGTSNLVYRQLHSGTNAGILVTHVERNYPIQYQILNTVPLISKVLLHTPLIIHPKSNKRKGMFQPTLINPMTTLNFNPNEYFTLPMWVGDSLCHLVFHRNYTAIALGCVNLFELAQPSTVASKQPDLIILFGINDGMKDTTYYHDKINDIWVGKISIDDPIDYFGYFKKMALTLHNLKNIHAKKLPIHGAMIEITFKDGSRKGVVLMGDSGAGKSESIAAMTKIAGNRIDHQEVIFDDMGAMYFDENNNIVASGTEIGAFVRLDDLDKGTAYNDLDRSIFFNPETSNSRVVLPTTPYKDVVASHKVDVFLYANNYDERLGVNLFDDVESAKQVFKQGRRFALGTTNEVGISDTFFANPFGPMQEQELTNPLIDDIFTAIHESSTVQLGQIFTHLGREDKGDDKLEAAANALLDLIAPKE